MVVKKEMGYRLFVVIAGWQKLDTIIANKIHHPMLLSQTPRPNSGGEIFEWFGLADAREGGGAKCS